MEVVMSLVRALSDILPSYLVASLVQIARQRNHGGRTARKGYRSQPSLSQQGQGAESTEDESASVKISRRVDTRTDVSEDETDILRVVAQILRSEEFDQQLDLG